MAASSGAGDRFKRRGEPSPEGGERPDNPPRAVQPDGKRLEGIPELASGNNTCGAQVASRGYALNNDAAEEVAHPVHMLVYDDYMSDFGFFFFFFFFFFFYVQ